MLSADLFWKEYFLHLVYSMSGSALTKELALRDRSSRTYQCFVNEFMSLTPLQ